MSAIRFAMRPSHRMGHYGSSKTRRRADSFALHQNSDGARWRVMTDPGQSSEDVSVAAILAMRSRAAEDELLEDLAALRAETVPAAQIERSLLRRRVTSVRLPLGQYVYALRKGARDSYEALRQQ